MKGALLYVRLPVWQDVLSNSISELDEGLLAAQNYDPGNLCIKEYRTNVMCNIKKSGLRKGELF